MSKPSLPKFLNYQNCAFLILLQFLPWTSESPHFQKHFHITQFKIRFWKLIHLAFLELIPYWAEMTVETRKHNFWYSNLLSNSKNSWLKLIIHHDSADIRIKLMEKLKLRKRVIILHKLPKFTNFMDIKESSRSVAPTQNMST